MVCAVAGCRYLVEAWIEDYPVCHLHDAPQVLSILMRCQRPGAFWMHDKPIVLPCGPLLPEHVAPGDGEPRGRAADDPALHAADRRPSRSVHRDFDLTLG